MNGDVASSLDSGSAAGEDVHAPAVVGQERREVLDDAGRPAIGRRIIADQ